MEVENEGTCPLGRQLSSANSLFDFNVHVSSREGKSFKHYSMSCFQDQTGTDSVAV